MRRRIDFLAMSKRRGKELTDSTRVGGQEESSLFVQNKEGRRRTDYFWQIKRGEKD